MIPDVLGRDLEQARAALEAAGYQIEVTETRSPRAVTLAGPLRVVRQRAASDGLVRLAVTRERYLPASRPPGG
ncbi:MAG: PASTA domain-containing protein [Armatimonadetes bacterium]|nr:PASTA domain-containing protein [Armatimonadota bacterium]